MKVLLSFNSDDSFSFPEQLDGDRHRRLALEEPAREERRGRRLLLERHLQPVKQLAIVVKKQHP